MPAETIDGMERLDRSRGRGARRSSTRAPATGPYFVEAITYRFVGHSRSDPGKYRPEGELDRWRERDPLVVAAHAARERRSRRARDSTSSTREVAAELEQMEERGLAAPFPEPRPFRRVQRREAVDRC